MNRTDELRFAVSDRVDNVDVGPKHVSLALIGEFHRDVTEFLRGSTRDVDPKEVNISIEEGSLAFVASGLLAASSLWADLTRLESFGLDGVDPKRVIVVERWISNSRQNPNRRYGVADRQGSALFSVNSKSNFVKMPHLWVSVEKYLHGRIVDMGGKKNVNVHLELENGETLTISSTQALLAEGDSNRLYRDALLHVVGEENLSTGDLRNLQLIGFQKYHPVYVEEEFNNMVARSANAWENVPDGDSWLENLRGGAA